ncbi:Protein clmp1 [Salvia divinorum]|uniref:Protein clmp1 n=1 Tax=Salvia divinorum TaxID=28513 RepID=A0ABD1I196_SALDI
MGKSGGRKKKAAAAAQNKVSGDENHSPPVVNGGVKLDSSLLLKRAHELKEEDRAVFHSNRAACLMQMKPIDYETVISECNLALQVQPNFVRALLRRARAFEAVGKYETAMRDVQSLLVTDPNNVDAVEIAGRLRIVLGPRQEAQQDLQSRPSPAALGASAIRGAPITGLGPCLPARPVPKKQMPSANVPSNKSEKLYPVPPIENGTKGKNHLPKVVLKPSNGSSRSNTNAGKDNNLKEQLPSRSIFTSVNQQSAEPVIQYRQLKLVYDHDIRLAQMPVNCSLKVLREIVGKRFPMSKAVLIKYKDSDGDLVTVTCSAELRLAESTVDNLIPKDPDTEKGDTPAMLKLHIVEVSLEQEPPLLEEEESVAAKGDENVSQSSGAESVGEAADSVVNSTEKVAQKDKAGGTEDPECKEVEMDDWLFEFAQLFRTHVGIDPDAHIDLHELGMELCSEALEETVTSDEAQSLFDKAALKFQEVVALAFFNWGNVHMCAARKRMPIDESADKETMNEQLQNAYDWVQDKYTLAKEKYEEALLIKPDFYEGLLALGQQQFEMAKLHWSFVLAKKEDLSKWDPTETIGLFDSAEEKMKTATAMWEKLEEQRANELKDPSANKKDELLKRKKKQGSGAQGDSSVGDISPEEAAEQAAVMRSQIHLFWGNMLFERSQIECKLNLPGWDKNLEVAVGRFKLAGASEADIETVVKNHCSNGEAADGNEKKTEEDVPAAVVNKADD